MGNKDLISRSEAIRAFAEKREVWYGNGPLPSNESLMWQAAISITEKLPAVNAAPVVHARPVWINPLDPGAKICTWKCSSLCSACGDYVAMGWKHCQNCGAKLDEEVA